MVNIGSLAAEIGPVVWGSPANFNGFRVLAVLLHCTPAVGVSVEQRAPPIFGRAAITFYSCKFSFASHFRQLLLKENLLVCH